MTSIEWLMKELYTEMNLSGNGRVLDEILKEAKEMHKQEIINFANNYSDNCIYCSGEFAKEKSAEEYYQETFVSKGSDETLKDYHIVNTNEMIDQVIDVRKMKRSAVTFLIEQIEGRGYFSNEFPLKRKTIEHIIKRALEIEQEIQETLYTEEQVREAYFKGAADVHDKCTDRTWRGVETKVDIELLKKLNAEYIQSLKQPKKD
jgi:hypothetical protein